MTVEERNAEATRQALRASEARLQRMEKQLVGFEVALRTAMGRMTSLEALVVAHKVAITGHGPSVK